MGISGSAWERMVVMCVFRALLFVCSKRDGACLWYCLVRNGSFLWVSSEVSNQQELCSEAIVEVVTCMNRA